MLKSWVERFFVFVHHWSIQRTAELNGQRNESRCLTISEWGGVIDIHSLADFVCARLSELLPQPVKPLLGSGAELSEAEFLEPTYVVGGEPEEVVAGIVGDSLKVYLFNVEWKGSHTPSVCPKLFRTIPLASLPSETRPLDEILGSVIGEASKIRRKRFRTCRFCQLTIPPEYQHDRSTCQSCAEQHLGIVH